MTKHIFRPPNRAGKPCIYKVFILAAVPPIGQDQIRGQDRFAPHGRDARAYMVSSETSGDLLAYWEEIPANA